MKAKGCTGPCDCLMRWTSLSPSSKTWAKYYLGARLVLGWIWSYWEVLYTRKADDSLSKTCFSIFLRSWGPHKYICWNILPPNPMGSRIPGFPSWSTLDLLQDPEHAGSPTLLHPSQNQNQNHLSIWTASSGGQGSDPCLVAKFVLITILTDKSIKAFPSQLSLSHALNAKRKNGEDLTFPCLNPTATPKVKLPDLEGNKILFVNNKNLAVF